MIQICVFEWMCVIHCVNLYDIAFWSRYVFEVFKSPLPLCLSFSNIVFTYLIYSYKWLYRKLLAHVHEFHCHLKFWVNQLQQTLSLLSVLPTIAIAVVRTTVVNNYVLLFYVIVRVYYIPLRMCVCVCVWLQAIFFSLCVMK